MTLHYRIIKEGNRDTIYFNGRINEDAEVTLAELKDKVGSECAFNLRDVAGINSLGVRAWIQFMRSFETGRKIVLEECTPEIVNQINMIPNFKGTCDIQSVYASYACENCGTEKLHLFVAGDNMPKNPETETLARVPCPKCGTPMEMEELESEFFGWLALQ